MALEGLWPGRSNLQEVAPRVFISNRWGATSLPKLEAAGITHVLACGWELPTPFEGEKVYKRVSIADDTHARLADHLDEALHWMEEALAADPHHAVLVHCAGGHSRSGAMVTAYVMKTRSIGVEEALAIVREARPVVTPNPGFLEQLEQWHRERG